MSKGTERIEIIARGLIRHGSRVLLCRNEKGRYLYLPGGHVEPGEAAADALRRELDEEAGLHAIVGDCLLVHEHRFSDGRRPHHELNLVFHVEQILPGPHGAEGEDERGDPLVRSREPKIAFEWVELAAVVDRDVRPDAAKAWLASGGDVGAPATAWLSDSAPS